MTSLFKAREIRHREPRDDALFIHSLLTATPSMPEETNGPLSSWDNCLGGLSYRELLDNSQDVISHTLGTGEDWANRTIVRDQEIASALAP
jgi:hypothetical protein